MLVPFRVTKTISLPFPGAALTACAMLCGSLAAAVRRQNSRRPHRGVGAENVARRAEGPVLTLGTRGSPLALAQAYEAKKRLGEALPGESGELVVWVPGKQPLPFISIDWKPLKTAIQLA